MNKAFNFIFDDVFNDVDADVKLILFDDDPVYHFSTLCVNNFMYNTEINMPLSDFKVLCDDERNYCSDRDCLTHFAFNALSLDKGRRVRMPLEPIENFLYRTEKLKTFTLPLSESNNNIFKKLNYVTSMLLASNEMMLDYIYDTFEFNFLADQYLTVREKFLTEVAKLHADVSFMSYLKDLCLAAATDTELTSMTKVALSEGENPWVLVKYEQNFNDDLVSNVINLLYPFLDGEVTFMPAVYALGVNRVNTFEDFLYLDKKPTDEVLETVKTMFVEEHDTFGSLEELLSIAELV